MTDLSVPHQPNEQHRNDLAPPTQARDVPAPRHPSPPEAHPDPNDPWPSLTARARAGGDDAVAALRDAHSLGVATGVDINALEAERLRDPVAVLRAQAATDRSEPKSPEPSQPTMERVARAILTVTWGDDVNLDTLWAHEGARRRALTQAYTAIAAYVGSYAHVALPEHLRGDGPCHDCGTPDNIRWTIDSAIWNHVLGGPEARDDPGGILCIPCFVKRADVAGFGSLWHLGHGHLRAETSSTTNARLARLDLTPLEAGELRAEGGVLGSSRRAQDEPVNLAEGPDAVVCRLAGELWRLGSGLAELGIPLDETVSVDQAPVTTALDALRARPSEPVPSQGQDIPDDQLDALHDELKSWYGQPAEVAEINALKAAYRIGFAAALGHKITIDQDGRVGVGDRPEPTA